MLADTFMRAEFSGLALEAVAEAYADWALGLTTPKSRGYRLKEGVLESWTRDQVLASGSLVGDFGCRVEMRLSPAKMVCRYFHRDTEDGAVLWHVVGRAQRRGGEVVVEHAVGRDAPRDHRLSPIASPSRIILDLVSRDGVDVRPRDLALDPVRLAAGEVRGFVEHVLTHPDRQLPLVLVACDRGGGPPLVDFDALGRQLRGICGVALLTTEDATFELADALADTGFGPEFRCYHGAIHTYGPVETMGENHRLWLGDSLRTIERWRRTGFVAGLLAHREATRSTPPGFFTSIEEHDRSERRQLAQRLSEHRSTPPPANQDPAIEREIQELREALKKALEDERSAASAWERAEQEKQDAEVARDLAEGRQEQERLRAAGLQDQLQAAKSGPVDDPSRDAVRALLEKRLTPARCLDLIRVAYPDRIVVLDSASKSAEDSSDFRFSEKLFDLLSRLAGPYFEQLAAGRGDGEASKVFSPNTFAAKESETTSKNARAQTERTFTWRGRTVVMWPHLKIGAAETTAETIRVHFEWFSKEQRIVIGWCGEHRYRVG